MDLSVCGFNESHAAVVPLACFFFFSLWTLIYTTVKTHGGFTDSVFESLEILSFRVRGHINTESRSFSKSFLFHSIFPPLLFPTQFTWWAELKCVFCHCSIVVLKCLLALSNLPPQCPDLSTKNQLLKMSLIQFYSQPVHVKKLTTTPKEQFFRKQQSTTNN